MIKASKTSFFYHTLTFSMNCLLPRVLDKNKFSLHVIPVLNEPEELNHWELYTTKQYWLIENSYRTVLTLSQSYYQTLVNTFLKVWMDTWTDKEFSNREFSTNSKKSKHTHIKQINLSSNIIEFTGLHDWSLMALWKKLAYNQFHNILRLFDVFTKFSFPGKWNDVRLLLINIVYTSYLTTFLTN